MAQATRHEPRNLRRGRSRKAFLLAILVMLCGLWAFASVDNYRLRSSLEQSSQDEVAHYQKAFTEHPGTEMVTAVTASRTYLFFGETIGKVDVFVKTTPQEGAVRYSGVEIGFKRQGDTWVVTDSGSCSSEECVLKARNAFGDTGTTPARGPSSTSQGERAS
jgi:hypothetical protein